MLIAFPVLDALPSSLRDFCRRQDRLGEQSEKVCLKMSRCSLPVVLEHESLRLIQLFEVNMLQR